VNLAERQQCLLVEHIDVLRAAVKKPVKRSARARRTVIFCCLQWRIEVKNGCLYTCAG